MYNMGMDSFDISGMCMKIRKFSNNASIIRLKLPIKAPSISTFLSLISFGKAERTPNDSTKL